MKTIYKYTMKMNLDVQEFDIPLGAIILDAQTQNNQIVFWALVDTDQITFKAKFFLAETGKPLLKTDGRVDYIGSCAVGKWVGHLFRIV